MNFQHLRVKVKYNITFLVQSFEVFFKDKIMTEISDSKTYNTVTKLPNSEVNNISDVVTNPKGYLNKLKIKIYIK